MKKRVLALLLGGVMAVGSLCMQGSITAQAAANLGTDNWNKWKEEHNCTGCSDAHISSSKITAGGGQLKVTVGVSFAEENTEGLIEGSCGGAVYVCEEEWTPANGVGDGKTYYNFETSESGTKAKKFFAEGVKVNGNIEITFDGLTSGKTYYVYCHVYDVHGENEAVYGEHYAVCLGTGTPTAASTSSGSASSGSSASCGTTESTWTSYENKVTDKIEKAESGSTVEMEKGVTTISNSMMKELAAKRDVSLKLEFTYGGEEYVIIIPAGAALDDDIPWYGPLYLAQKFGNSAGVAESRTYEVKRGDSLNKIATANKMTLTEILTKNPDIKNPNKIMVGQKINL